MGISWKNTTMKAIDFLWKLCIFVVNYRLKLISFGIARAFIVSKMLKNLSPSHSLGSLEKDISELKQSDKRPNHPILIKAKR